MILVPLAYIECHTTYPSSGTPSGNASEYPFLWLQSFCIEKYVNRTEQE